MELRLIPKPMNSSSPQSTLWQRSTSRRFLRWLFSWRTLRAMGFVVFCLVTLVVLVLAEENWRGRRALERFQQEWSARGERFDLASFIPKPVPAEQNFAMTPFLAPLLNYDFVQGKVVLHDSNGVERAKSVSIYQGEDRLRRAPSQGNWQRGQFCDLKGWQAFYRGNTNYPANPQPGDPARDILAALQQYEPVLAELRVASRRPYASFPVHYGEGFAVLLTHFSVLKASAQLVQLHALASLEANRSQDALADIDLGMYFATSLQSEPMLISHLVRIALLGLQIQPVWEGLARHRWSEEQLAELQKTLSSFHLLKDYGDALRGERACGDQALAQMRLGQIPGWDMPKLLRLLMPSGWLYQNQLVIDRVNQEIYLPIVDVAQHRVYPERCDTNALASALGKRSPYTLFARMLMPDFLKASLRFARAQTMLDEAVVACALERCRLATGRLPDSLEGLVPRFVDKVPRDILNGQPLRYRPRPDGGYVLYSVGWNQTDEGGEVALTKGQTPSIDLRRGDWVWQMPSTPN
jgi:hypothetical protein